MFVNEEFPIIIFAFEFVLQIFILTFLFSIYKKVLIPQFLDNFSNSKNENCDFIIKKYLFKRKIEDIKIIKDNNANFYNSFSAKNNTLEINRLEVFENSSFYINGIVLDYCISRGFLVDLSIKKPNTMLYFKLLLYVLPIIFNITFYFFFILQMILYSVAKIDYNLILDIWFLFLLYKFNILSLISSSFFILWIFIIFINPKIKEKLEDLYELNVTNYVSSNYPLLYNEWIIARRFSRSNKYTYTTGFGFLFKKNYVYTGILGV